MIKYILALYVTVNGVCNPDMVYMWGNAKEISIESSTFEIHAVRAKNLPYAHRVYTDGVYYYAINTDFAEGFTLSIYVFQLVNKEVVPVKGILITDSECNN